MDTANIPDKERKVAAVRAAKEALVASGAYPKAEPEQQENQQPAQQAAPDETKRSSVPIDPRANVADGEEEPVGYAAAQAAGTLHTQDARAASDISPAEEPVTRNREETKDADADAVSMSVPQPEPVPEAPASAKEEAVSAVRPPKPAQPQTPVPAQEQQAAPAAAPHADPLMLPDVEKGLADLLSEWDIFKSSGFLGFGSGGKEHPLYVSIKDLPVEAVLTGRFEDAEPKVVSEIKAYMEGWKREQNIQPEPQETFEHYLRRVIAHILKLA